MVWSAENGQKCCCLSLNLGKCLYNPSRQTKHCRRQRGRQNISSQMEKEALYSRCVGITHTPAIKSQNTFLCYPLGNIRKYPEIFHLKSTRRGNLWQVVYDIKSILRFAIWKKSKWLWVRYVFWTFESWIAWIAFQNKQEAFAGKVVIKYSSEEQDISTAMLVL